MGADPKNMAEMCERCGGIIPALGPAYREPGTLCCCQVIEEGNGAVAAPSLDEIYGAGGLASLQRFHRRRKKTRTPEDRPVRIHLDYNRVSDEGGGPIRRRGVPGGS